MSSVEQHTNPSDIAVKSLPDIGIDSDDISTLKNANIHYAKAPGVDLTDYSKRESSDFTKESSFDKSDQNFEKSSQPLVPQQHVDPSDISIKSLPNDGIDSDDISTLKNATIHYAKAPGVDDNTSSSPAQKSLSSGSRSSHAVEQHVNPSDISIKSLPNDGIDSDDISTLKNATIHYAKAPGVDEESSSLIDKSKQKASETLETAREKANELSQRVSENWEAAKERGKEILGLNNEDNQSAQQQLKEKSQELKDKAALTAQQLKEKASETSEKLKEKTTSDKAEGSSPSTAQKAEIKTEELKADAKRNANELKDQTYTKIEQSKQNIRDAANVASAVTNELKENAKQTFEQGRDKAMETYEQGKERAMRAFEQGKEKANEVYETVVQKSNNAIESGKQSLFNAKEEAKQDAAEAKQDAQKLKDETREEGQSLLNRASAMVGSAVHAVQEKTSELADSARQMLGLASSDTTTEVYELHEKEVGKEPDGSIRVEKSEKWTKQEGLGPKQVKESNSEFVRPANDEQ